MYPKFNFFSLLCDLSPWIPSTGPGFLADQVFTPQTCLSVKEPLQSGAPPFPAWVDSLRDSAGGLAGIMDLIATTYVQGSLGLRWTDWSAYLNRQMQIAIKKRIQNSGQEMQRQTSEQRHEAKPGIRNHSRKKREIIPCQKPISSEAGESDEWVMSWDKELKGLTKSSFGGSGFIGCCPCVSAQAAPLSFVLADMSHFCCWGWGGSYYRECRELSSDNCSLRDSIPQLQPLPDTTVSVVEEYH